MPNIWEDFAWSASKRLRIRTHHKCHIIFQGGMDFWRIPPFSCPSSPTPQTECLQHLQTFTFTLWSSSTLRYQILSSLPFLIFITLKLLNSPPPLSLSLSLPLQLSPLSHCSPSNFPSNSLAQSLSSSLSRSSLSFHHTLVLCLLHTFTHTVSFPPSPAILWHSYPLIPYLSVPPFPPARRHPPLFLLPSFHLILTRWLFFTPVCSSLPSSLPSKPIIDSRGCAAHY